MTLSVPLPILSSRTAGQTIAALLFGLFAFSIFFLKGVPANAIGTLCVLAAWGWIIVRARRGEAIDLHLDWIIVLLLAAFAVRVLLPPYGTASGAFSAKGLTHVLLLVGLFGLARAIYGQIRFSDLLWILAAGAAISALASLLLYVLDGNFGPVRLTFIGRSSNSITGTGGIIAGLAAGLVLLRQSPALATSLKAGLVGMIAIDAAAVYLSGSRGPMLSILFAAVVGLFLARRRSWQLLCLAGAAAWSLVTAAVTLEGAIEEVLCSFITLACRSSNRHDVWLRAVDSIREHPLLGVGSNFRYTDEMGNNPHNGFLGLAFFYGIPLLVLFLVFLARSAADIATLEHADEKYLLVLLFVFSLGYMGSDLSDPIRFFNTHYLFLWLPLFLGRIGTKQAAADVP